MQVIKISDVPKVHRDNPIFTEPDQVTRQPLFPESKEYDIQNMNFGKGVRNKFHTHANEQILIVSAGKGICATEREERVVTVGDIIFFPAGEIHWHGAAKDSEFSHIFVHKKDTELTQLED